MSLQNFQLHITEITNIKGAPKNITENVFVYTTEIIENTSYYVKHKFTVFHIKLYIYMQQNKFTSYKQYLFGHLFYRNAKNTRTNQSIL